MSRQSVLRGWWLAVVAPPALGQSAARDLPDPFVVIPPTVTVTVAIEPPPGVGAVGLEDRPPTTWSVLSISDSGSFDAQSGKVKWGPFLAPSIPASVSYELSSPPTMSGEVCFSGTVSFDGLDAPITGDACILPPVPAVSEWGLVLIALLLCTAGTLVLKSRSAPRPAERFAATVPVRGLGAFLDDRLGWTIRLPRPTSRPLGRPPAPWCSGRR